MSETRPRISIESEYWNEFTARCKASSDEVPASLAGRILIQWLDEGNFLPETDSKIKRYEALRTRNRPEPQ